MLFEGLLRTQLPRLLIKESDIVLENKIPALEKRFQNIDEFGLYLHIPFCRQICPYCPYNKELYQPEVAERYAEAVIKEIDIYAKLIGNRPVTSFYIGGGTPTTMLTNGLGKILERVFSKFNMQCCIHLESHPNDLTSKNLDIISSMGVENLSMGIEALQNHHLKALCRPYTVKEATAAIARACSRDFKCVNVDIMFALPNQTYAEVEETGQSLVEMGVDQVAAYPIFIFDYTRMGETGKKGNCRINTILKRRKMLGVLERIFYNADFERTSVWAFTKKGVPKYCSVTVPLYIGLGASGGSYLKDVFYLNTFNVAEYIKAIEKGSTPIALSIDLTENMQMASWLYWRIYETRFKRSDFKKRFGKEFNEIYGKYFKLFSLFGFLQKDNGDEIVFSDNGTYWLHVLQDIFSLDYIAKLWGTSKQTPWPKRVVL